MAAAGMYSWAMISEGGLGRVRTNEQCLRGMRYGSVL